ncbi:MAG TPA: hypothetical protein DCE56_18465 [Cyanobacteria bacterium UBA8553]|nr:hypothetical protein [Cyanobacteria bacterium UBA8553]HAJ63273.1 hypothetical protein [Cyanobacteria bacterium UBA8543]
MIYYRIEPLTKGYQLTIWEPAPVNSDRVKPFRFKINFTTSNLLESMKILNLIPGRKTDERYRKLSKQTAQMR